MKCVHWFEWNSSMDRWECQDCPKNTFNPWTFGETKNHTHDWQPSDMEEWAECCGCGIQVQCDHDCDHEVDTVETPYMDFNGYNTHERKGNFCIRCGTEEIPEEPEYDRDDL